MTRINMATEPTYRLHPRTGRSKTCGAVAIGRLLGIPTDEVLREWRRITHKRRCRGGMEVGEIMCVITGLGYDVRAVADCKDAKQLDRSGRYILIMRDHAHAVAMAGGKVADNGSWYPRPVPVEQMEPVQCAIEIGEPRACQ